MTSQTWAQRAEKAWMLDRPIHRSTTDSRLSPPCRDSPVVRWQSIAEALRQLQGSQVLPARQLLQTGNPRMLLATLAWLFTCRPGAAPPLICRSSSRKRLVTQVVLSALKRQISCLSSCQSASYRG